MTTQKLDSKISQLLKKRAEEVGKQDGLTGDLLIPTLADLQQMAVDMPTEKGVSVLSLNSSYCVFISSTHTEEENIHTMSWVRSWAKANLPHKEGSNFLIFETQRRDEHAVLRSANIVQEADNERMERYFAIVAQHIIRTAGEPAQESLQWLHMLWVEEAPQTPHPLLEVVRAWIREQRVTKVTTEHDRRFPVAILKHPTGSIREITFTENDTASVLKTPESVEQVQMQMDLEEKSYLPSIMPLEVVKTAHLKPQTKNGAVSHELRMFFEAMMALENNKRRADLMFRLGDLIDFLYPNGKFHWTNQFPHIERALNVLHSDATIPWIDDTGSLRRWRPVSVRTPIALSEATRDSPIYFDVALPPDARQGHIVIKGIHRLLGMKSAAQWNAYHVAAYLWDKYGTINGKLAYPTKPIEIRDAQGRLTDPKGQPIVNSRGKPSKSIYAPEAVRQLPREPNPDAINRYPVLSLEDLIRACFPNGYHEKGRREYLKRAKAHWEQLEADGILVIHKERNGWRILPSSDHLNAHRAVRKAREGMY